MRWYQQSLHGSRSCASLKYRLPTVAVAATSHANHSTAPCSSLSGPSHAGTDRSDRQDACAGERDDGEEGEEPLGGVEAHRHILPPTCDQRRQRRVMFGRPDGAGMMHRCSPCWSVPDAIAEHADAVVVDVRWYLDGRDGRAAYESGHLPRAVWVDLDRDLAAHGRARDRRTAPAARRRRRSPRR